GVIINASGCGTTVAEYGRILAGDEEPGLVEDAERLAALSMDITVFLESLGALPDPAPEADPQAKGFVVAYHAACSLQHGQKVREAPKALLRSAGFAVREIAESHLCCGSAGTYSILQADLSQQLRERKVANLEAEQPQAIAAGNIGCISHIAGGTEVPVIHTVELLDWALGGPKPEAL
ncbi:MAG: heterodisulfide reductase-related iron-sulfur binding cluster, partial [Rhodospirillaceae bacterium]